MTWMQEPEWAHVMVWLKAIKHWAFDIWTSIAERFDVELPYEVALEAIDSIWQRAIDHTNQASHGGAWRDLDSIEVLVLVAYANIACGLNDRARRERYRRFILDIAGVDDERTLQARRPVEFKEYYQANFKPLF